MLSQTAAEPRFQRIAYSPIDIDQFTVGERLALLEQVWDSRRRGADANEAKHEQT